MCKRPGHVARECVVKLNGVALLEVIDLGAGLQTVDRSCQLEETGTSVQLEAAQATRENTRATTRSTAINLSNNTVSTVGEGGVK